MDLAGYVINAVLVEGRSVKEVCEAHDISRSWLYELIARYRELGEDGLKPRSKRHRQVTCAATIKVVKRGGNAFSYRFRPLGSEYSAISRYSARHAFRTVWRVSAHASLEPGVRATSTRPAPARSRRMSAPIR